MTTEDVALMAYKAIREEAQRASGITAERLGHYVRGVLHLSNEIVVKLTIEQFKVNSPYRGGYTHTEKNPGIIYTDTDSVKEDPDA